MSSKILGIYGEEQACKYLQNRGYVILKKNFRNKLGEIDLIAQDGKVICFIEVKFRKSLNFGEPFESVHPNKCRKIARVALSYLKYTFNSVEIPSRFDVVSIYEDVNKEQRIEHIVSAFDLTYISH